MKRILIVLMLPLILAADKSAQRAPCSVPLGQGMEVRILVSPGIFAESNEFKKDDRLAFALFSTDGRKHWFARMAGKKVFYCELFDKKNKLIGVSGTTNMTVSDSRKFNGGRASIDWRTTFPSNFIVLGATVILSDRFKGIKPGDSAKIVLQGVERRESSSPMVVVRSKPITVKIKP